MKDQVLYFEKDKSDISLRQQLLSEGVQTIEVDDYIDPHFMQHIEMKKLGDHQIKFSSLDAEIANILGTENATENDQKVKDLFESILSPKTDETEEEKKEEEANPFSGDDKLDIEVQNIKNSTTPAFFKVDEQMKRLSKMTMSMGNNPFPVKKTLVINPSNPLILNALKISETGNKKELVEKICHYVEDLAYISSEGLKVENRDSFVKRSQELISDLTTLAL